MSAHASFTSALPSVQRTDFSGESSCPTVRGTLAGRSTRMKSIKLLSVFIVLVVAGVTARVGHTSGLDSGSPASASVAPAFSPSNARTEDGKLIPAEQFFSAERCASCHKDTHAAWAESLHRNSAREPFYKESVDILEHARGSKPTQHCESCHSPVAVFSGSLTNGSKGPRPLEDEGVTCVVCHSKIGRAHV